MCYVRESDAPHLSALLRSEGHDGRPASGTRLSETASRALLSRHDSGAFLIGFGNAFGADFFKSSLCYD